MSTLRCPSCTHPNRADRRYCASCGAHLGQACPACGTRNEPEEKFCGACGLVLSGAAADGERRQLTVLFCDLVGSTAIAGQLDPEDWRQIAAEYQRAAAETMTRFGGHVAKYLGDGLLVYFGYPQAHEDDPERAVRAGLALLDTVAELNRRTEPAHGVRLAVRVGMHTGPVVIGEGAGSGTEVFGDTPNVAARVQALADPDAVLITETTHRLVAGRFIVEAKGAPPLKGVRQAVPVFRVVQASGARNRLTAAGPSGLTHFVGREGERRLLGERWAQVRAGEGQMVLISGEAGIGKSRLAHTFKEELAGEPHTWIECASSPYHQNTPFFLVTEMLQQGLAWDGTEPSGERLHRLERDLARDGLRLPEAVPLLAPLLGLPPPDQYPPLPTSPEQQRRLLLATLTAWLFGAARVKPIVLVVEDMQWVDPSTLELHSLFAEQGATAPVLLLYTARPEFRTPWPLLAHHTQLMLGRLGSRHVREMVAYVAARAELTEPVIEAVVNRTDGNPLYVEELTKALVEADAGDAIAARPIPTTLQDSLMARLDRLGGAKELAQVGAVIGREFSYALLQAVSRFHDAELQAALARLVDAELLYPRGLPPEAAYTFKHALVRDAAYASLLKSRRRELHRTIARLLAEQFPETVATQPELIAAHYTEAGEAEVAVAAWQQAGELARTRGAHREAVRHLRRGLEILAGSPEGPARGKQEIRLLLPLAQALMMTEAFASPEVTEALARARVLSSKYGDPLQSVFLLLNLAASAVYRGGPRAAQPLADDALAAAEQAGRSSLLMMAHNAQAMNRFFAGELAGARQHCDRALALYDEAKHAAQPANARIPMHRVSTFTLAAMIAWHEGRATEAREYAHRAEDLAERARRPAERASAETNVCFLYVLLREPAAVREHADRAASAEQEAMARASGTLMMLRGWALAEEGQTQDGLAAIRVGLERFTASGQQFNLEFHLGLLADAHASAGNVHEALTVLAAAEGSLPGEEVWRSDTLRRRAELLARRGADAATVEATFQDALAVARRQGSKSYALRAGTRYALFLRALGRVAEARELLTPICASFSADVDTRDLREATMLLAELG